MQTIKHAKTKGDRYEIMLRRSSYGQYEIKELTHGKYTGGFLFDTKATEQEALAKYNQIINDAQTIDGINYIEQ